MPNRVASRNYTRMKKAIALIIAAYLLVPVIAQTKKVKGNITADTADLTILNVSPDSFPHVDVLFKAETRKKEPVWNLSKEKMMVTEDQQSCRVISLEQVSKNKSINLGIVIDHSGSMAAESVVTTDASGNQIFMVTPGTDSTSPLEHAKSAVKRFVNSFNTSKDFISITGFSNVADRQLPLTQNTHDINAIVDSMQADFSTALYDAMITGIHQIRYANGIKVLVVLSDGQDNLSAATWKNVVDSAVKAEVPIYIIGLGMVNKDTLQLIAAATRGQFYYTASSASLDTVYSIISKQVQAFYNLVYESPNFSSADTTRQIRLSFDVDSIYLATNTVAATFPKEVTAALEKKDKKRIYIIYDIAASAAVLAAGVLVFSFKRRKQLQHLQQPVIVKLFPNPAKTFIVLECTGLPTQLVILDLSGRVRKQLTITGATSQADISDLPDGTYTAIASANSQPSNAVTFIIQQ